MCLMRPYAPHHGESVDPRNRPQVVLPRVGPFLLFQPDPVQGVLGTGEGGGEVSRESGSGGLTLLLLLFIALKLTGVITWSWWWVLSPFWIPLVLALAVMAVAALLSNRPR